MQLPGRISDSSARTLREQFLANEVNTDEFLQTYAWHFPKTHAARFLNQVQSYAVGSLVIDHFWEYLKEHSIQEGMIEIAKKYGDGSYQERIHTFSRCLDGVLGIFQNRYIEELRAMHTIEKPYAAFVHYLCYASITRRRHLHLKGLPFPSMKDLPTMLVRMTGIIPEVFARDMGRSADRTEILAILRHPSILHLFVQFMSNDRKAAHPLFRSLETTGKIDLNNLRGSFDSACFEMHEKDGIYSIHLKPSIIQAHRKKHERAALRRTRRGQPPRPTLACPALYTGQFRDMYMWTVGLLEPWL